MNKYSIFAFVIWYSISATFGQNYFIDPFFNEPTAPYNATSENCGDRGKIFDEYSKVYFRVGDGSPDIVVPIKEDCKWYVSSPLVKSQCLGMVFYNATPQRKRSYKEPVFTTLNRTLIKNKTYEISFDILCNPQFYHTQNDVTLFNANHFNVILKSSSSDLSDTLTVSVAVDAHTNWESSKLVFKSKSDFDIVQFDFLSQDFFNSERKLYLNIYLDNFKLVASDENPKLFKKVKVENKSHLNFQNLSYYFNSNEKELPSTEKSRLLVDLKKLNLLDLKSVSIQAYTDNTNSIEYNNSLSSRRAQNILQVLRKHFKDDSIEYTLEGKGIDTHKNGEKARRVDINIKYKKGEVAPWYKTSNNEQSTFNYSYLGNIELGKRRDRVSVSKRFRKNDVPVFDDVPIDAHKMIIAKAKKAKVLIINESHTYPSHRAFISKLLPNLKDCGYNKLAVEAMQENDDPHSLTFKDPVFLRYLLDAQEKGYELLSYDNKTSAEPNWQDIKQIEGAEYASGYENVSRDMNIRDYNEFLNLEDDIDKLADGEKMIIHLGHGHGRKMQVDQWKPLGAYLSDKYGSDAILSIDQVTLNNCISIDSNDYYQQYRPTKSIVCASDRKPYMEKVFSPLTFSFESVVDLQILHPAIKAKLSIDTSYIYVKHTELTDAAYPLAIIIYESTADPRMDIAYSAIEVKHEEDLKPSIIPNSGRYKILIKDSKNKILAYNTHSQ